MRQSAAAPRRRPVAAPRLLALLADAYGPDWSADVRDKLLAELRTQQGKEFDQARAVSMGRQLGVAYFVTGRVVDNAERTADARRVQYFMFMQALDVATGAIVWQNEAAITKALVQQ